MKVLKWTILLAVVAWLVWRMVAVNLSAHYAASRPGQDAVSALDWVAGNPDALLTRAIALRDSDPAQARRLLQQGIAAQPGSGKMLSTLGRVLESQGDRDAAEQAMRFAGQLAPRASAVQADLAGFWGKRNDVGRYLDHLITLFELRPDDWAAGHPALLAIVDNPAYASLVRERLSRVLADGAPGWWWPFFRYAAGNAEQLDALRLLYSIDLAAPTSMGNAERALFLSRLEDAGEWVEAYFAWMNALSPERLGQVGNLFNGSFETPLMNSGFGWRGERRIGVDFATTSTQGASDQQALRLAFQAPFEDGAYLTQLLMLPGGRYVFSGRVRVDDIEPEQRLHWRFDCVAPERHPLMTTDYFNGAGPWRGFSLLVEVPAEACAVQQLLLVGRGRQAGEVPLGDARAGEAPAAALWFDDLGLRGIE